MLKHVQSIFDQPVGLKLILVSFLASIILILDSYYFNSQLSINGNVSSITILPGVILDFQIANMSLPILLLSTIAFFFSFGLYDLQRLDKNNSKAIFKIAQYDQLFLIVFIIINILPFYFIFEINNSYFFSLLFVFGFYFITLLAYVIYKKFKTDLLFSLGLFVIIALINLFILNLIIGFRRSMDF